MELLISPLLLTVLLFLLPLLYIFFKTIKHQAHNSNDSHPLPPGNSGWPIIGESQKYLSLAKKGMLEKFVTDRVNKYSTKVFKTSLFGEKMAILGTAEGNKFLFANEGKVVLVWWPITIQKILPNSDDITTATRESMRLRKALLSFVKPDILQKYIEVMDSLSKEQLLEDWAEKQVLVHPLIKKFTFALGCHLFFDIKDPQRIEELDYMFHILTAGFVSLPVNIPGTKFSKAIKARKQLVKEFESLIKQRNIDLLEKRFSPSEDILSRMLVDAAEDGESVNANAVALKIIALLIAAHDAVAVTILGMVNVLAEMPEIYSGVLREQMEIAKEKGPGEALNWEDINKMTYTWNVYKEVLRLYPTTPGTFKEVIANFTYEGFLIPKGWKVHLIASATHRNPEYFPNPCTFDPSRFEGKGPPPYAFVPFGGGSRMCPGNEYGRLEILIFIHNLVTKYRWEKVYPDEQIICDPVPRPAKGLPIRLYPLNL